jgi:hypothetical protein
MNAPLFRQRNCFASHLAASECLFRVEWPAGACVEPVEDGFREASALIGGEVRFEDADGRRAVVLVASHAAVDAFGGMYLCARWLKLPSASDRDVHRTGTAGAFVYHHFSRWAPAADRPDDRTLTQRMIGEVLPALGLDDDARAAVVVAKDDPRGIGDRTFAGNSFVSVDFSLGPLADLAAGTRETWRSAITHRSDRLRDVALRRPQLLRSEGAGVIFSSVGDVQRIPWAAQLSPCFFEMVPTPFARTSINVVFWGKGSQQALTLCAASEHPVARDPDRVRSAWERALV